MKLVVADLGWFDLNFDLPLHCPPNSAGTNGNLAELARKLGKIMECRNQSQPNLGRRPPVSSCSVGEFYLFREKICQEQALF